MIRWPGKIQAGAVSNEIVQHHDWLPTFLAAAGDPDIVEKLKQGHTIGDTTYKVHIDGLQPAPLPHRRGRQESRATGSSTSPTTATCSRSGSTTGRSCSWSSASRERCRSGLSRSSSLRVPEALQPPHRPVRASRHHLQHLLRLPDRERLHHPRRDRSGDAVPGDLQGVPAGQRAASFTIDQVVEKLQTALTSGQ